MISLIKKFYSDNFVPIKIGVTFSLILTSIPFIYYFLGLAYNLPFSIRTYLIDFWGYFWDGSHYIYISQSGYKFPLQAFFPGYPLLIKFVNLFLPLSLAFRVNYLIVLFMTISLYKFMDIFQFNKIEKIKSLVLFLSYPTSFFFLANYTEALYVLLSTWMLIYLSRNEYIKSSLVSFFVSLVKISSIIFPILLTIRFLRKNSKNISFYKLFELGILNLISVLGIILYFAYLQLYQKGYQIYFKAQAEWGRGSFSFINDYIGLQSEFYFERISEIVIFILLVGIFIWAYKKISSELYIFSIYHFLLPILTGTLLSINRLSLYCFPVLLFFFAKSTKNRIVFYLMFAILIIWQLAGIYVFINGNFVG